MELDGVALRQRYNTAPHLRRGLKSKGEKLRRLVFICTENANRSQMAEAFARHHGREGLE